MKYLMLVMFCMMFCLMGCSTAAGYVGLAQESVLPKLEPEQRATYRDGLQNAVNNYDEAYDREGRERYPLDAETETSDIEEAKPEEAPAEGDTTDDPDDPAEPEVP